MYETRDDLRDFTFLPVGSLRDGDLYLVLANTELMGSMSSSAPTYRFDMCLQGVRNRVGNVSLRIANTPHIVLYLGHIGYGVELHYRGHHYAARSCRLLLPLAKQHGLNALWITCNPDNYASRRTCELAGAQFVEIIDVPPDNPIYVSGEKQKCRYRLDIE